MTNQFSLKVSEILSFSKEEAIRLASDSVRPEHLLLGMLREKESPLHVILRQMGIETRMIKSELESTIERYSNNTPFSGQNDEEPILSEKANNILKLAVLEARLQHVVIVDVEHVLLAILHDRSDNGAKGILESYNINYMDAKKTLQHRNTTRNGISLSEEDDAEQISGSKGEEGGTPQRFRRLQRKEQKPQF